MEADRCRSRARSVNRRAIVALDEKLDIDIDIEIDIEIARLLPA